MVPISTIQQAVISHQLINLTKRAHDDQKFDQMVKELVSKSLGFHLTTLKTTESTMGAIIGHLRPPPGKIVSLRDISPVFSAPKSSPGVY